MRQEEFERLYEEHAGALFAFLTYRTGDRGLAEDLLADTFERAMRAGRRFDPRRGSRKTWLYTIALNLLRDRARRQGAEARALERAGAAAQPAGDAFEAVDRRDQIARAMAALSEEEREVLSLRFGAGLSVPEISRLIGEPLTTAEGRVYRALRKLRDELGPSPG